MLFSLHTYHSDDWDNLAYINEIGTRDQNLRDPFTGTDSPLHTRAAYNLSTWTYAGISGASGLSPVDVYHWLMPPVLVVASLAAVYFMMRQSDVPNLAIPGLFCWLFYFLSGSTGGRSPGSFFFDRIAQDKAIAWLVFLPILAGLLFRIRRTFEGDRYDTGEGFLGWLSSNREFAFFGVALAVATLVHPLAVVFGAMLMAALLLEYLWRGGRHPWSSFALPAVCALAPSGVLAGLFAVFIPAGGGGERIFKTDGPAIGLLGFPYEPTGARDIVDVGITFVVDPTFISPLNFPALLWIAWSLWSGRRTALLTVSASIYCAVAVASFLPGVPLLLSQLITTIGVWRLTWLMAVPATLSGADFLGWLIGDSSNTSRRIGLAALGMVLIVGLVPLAFSWSQLSNAAGSGGPTPSELVILQQIEVMTRDDSEVILLANDRISTFAPSYTSEVSVVFYPGLRAKDERAEAGITRRMASDRLDSARTYGNLIAAMEAWGASIVALDQNSQLFDRQPPRELETCFSTRSAVILALRDDGGCD
jgi:hypothetical protein